MNCESLLRDLLDFSGYHILIYKDYIIYDCDNKIVKHCINLTELLRFLLIDIAGNLENFWLE